MTDKPTIDNAAAQDGEAVAYCWYADHVPATAVVFDAPSDAEKARAVEQRLTLHKFYSASTVEALRAELSEKSKVIADAATAISNYQDLYAASQQRVRELEAENAAMKACALKYLSWLSIGNTEKGLQQDMRSVEMCGLAALSKLAPVQAASATERNTLGKMERAAIVKQSETNRE